MTRQRNRPSLGQAALMTGLLGVGGWLASSALSSGEANASELPPDHGSYADTVLSDPGSVDFTQLTNSVVDQVTQLRANGHDFSVGVAQPDSGHKKDDGIPAALRRQPDPDSDARKSWQQAARQVAATPSSPVLPRSTKSEVAETTDTGSVPVRPTDPDGAGTPDRRDDSQNAPGASVPLADATDATDAHSNADSDAPSDTPADVPDGADAPDAASGPGPVAPPDASGTGSETRTEIPDGAKERDRIGPNNKDSRAPDEIKDAGIKDTLFGKEQDISNIMSQVRGYLRPGEAQTQTGTSVPWEGPEALPGTGSDAGTDGSVGPVVTALVWQQLNQRVFDPIKARLASSEKLQTALGEQKSVTGSSPSSTDPDSYLDPDSDNALSDTVFQAGGASADLTDPDADAALGEVPVRDLPAPAPMRPYGWGANEDMPDPDAEQQEPQLSDEQSWSDYAERDANGQTRFVRSQGSVGSVGNQPQEEPSTTSQAQEEADAEAMAASEAQEQANLNAQSAALKASAAQTQQQQEANIAASQQQNAAMEQSEQRTQANEAATEAQAEAGTQAAETEAANGAAEQQTAAQSAAYLQEQQQEAAAELSRPAGGSDDATDITGDEGEDVVPETDPDDTSGSTETGEDTSTPDEVYDGETLSPEQQIETDLIGGGGEDFVEG